MGKTILTENQRYKNGNLSIDEIMNALTDDLDKNYDLLKRYILFHQLNGSRPIMLHHFIDRNNQISILGAKSGFTQPLLDRNYQSKALLAIKTLLKYGVNPNNTRDNYVYTDTNYVAHAILLGYWDEYIYETITEGLKYHLNINNRTHSTYRHNILNLYIREPRNLCNAKFLDLIWPKSNYNIGTFYEFLCNHGFDSVDIPLVNGQSLPEVYHTLGEIEQLEQYPHEELEKYKLLSIEQLKKKKATEDEVLEIGKLPFNDKKFIWVKDIPHNPEQKAPAFYYLIAWYLNGGAILPYMISDDLENNYKMLQSCINAQYTSFPLSICNFLAPQYEKESLLVIKTFLKYGFHPNDLGIGEDPQFLGMDNERFRTGPGYGIGNGDDGFIIATIKAGFSEEFIIEALNVAIKYGFDVNTLVREKSIMHYLIGEKKYTGKISTIYKLLCENGYDSTLTANFGYYKCFNLIEYLSCCMRVKTFQPDDIAEFMELYEQEIIKVQQYLGINENNNRITDDALVKKLINKKD